MPQRPDRFFRFHRQISDVSCLLRRFRGSQFFVGFTAVRFDLRVFSLDFAQKLVDLLFKFEIALFFQTVRKFHNQICHGREDALACVTAPAHRNPFVDSADIAVEDIIAAVKIKAVQIHRLLAESAGTDFAAALLVLRERPGVQLLIS